MVGVIKRSAALALSWYSTYSTVVDRAREPSGSGSLLVHFLSRLVETGPSDGTMKFLSAVCNSCLSPLVVQIVP